jgi:hypothetical protein
LELGGSTPAPVLLANLFNYSFVTLAVFIVTNKVLSPQYMVWLYPLFPLVSGRFRSAIWVAFLAAACLTWYIYPLHYYDLIDTQQVPVDTLFLRNTLLALIAVLLLGEKVQADPEAPDIILLEQSPVSCPEPGAAVFGG